ncbi:hypothetical protein As57867_023421, partial [Aphanomyces stellatus]
MVKIFTASIVGAAATTTALAGSITDFPKEMAALMDPTADPCTDFYKYACGTWYKTTDIPPTVSKVGTSFSVIQERNTQIIKDLVAAGKPKMTEFYNSCMDTATLNKLGVTPLDADLKIIRAANSTESVLRAAAKLSSKGVDIFIQPIVFADHGDARVNALYAAQADLPLDIDYFVDDKKWAFIEADYREYISTVLKLAGKTAAEAKAAEDAIVKFHQRFAGVQLNKIELMEAESTLYNPMPFWEANKKYPL